MRVIIEPKIDRNVRKQIEAKLNDEMKAGSLTWYEQSFPNGSIYIDIDTLDSDFEYIGVISDEDTDIILVFSMNSDLTLKMSTP